MWQAGLLDYDNEKGLEWEWQAIDGTITKAPLGGVGQALILLIVAKKEQREVC